MLGLEQVPVAGSQAPWAWQASAGGGQVFGFAPTQSPCWQTNAPKQAFGVAGVHAFPSWLGSGVQLPVVGSQTVHGAQLTGVPGWQLPFPSHVSVPLQALPSLQEVPAATGVVAQPAAGSQAAVRQGLPPVSQVFGVPPVQTPCWQVSPIRH
jgi:hypothetical protein